MKAPSAASLADEAADPTELLGTGSEPRPMDLLFRNTVEDAPVGIAFADRDGSFRHGNRAFCALLGFSAEELAARSITGITHPEDRISTASALDLLWSGKVTNLDVEKRYLRKDGTALWVRVSTSLVAGSGAQAECSVEFLRDISARKEMAAALARNRTLLATVIAELPLALVACDVTGKVTHCNPAATRLFGTVSEEAGAGSASPRPNALPCDIYLPDGTTAVPAEDRPLERALRGETVSNVEFVVTRPDGAARTTLSSARQLMGPAGEPLGALVVTEDITERRAAETELSRVHRQLLETSRHAGMAEIATNVLHNVGNVLNSVNVSASLVAERIKRSKCTGLTRVATLLAERSQDLPTFMASTQGQHLPTYLKELATELLSERDATVAELTALRGNVEHIKEIVSMQQSYARRGGVIDTVDVRALVEDSLRMNEGGFNRHGVTIVRDFQQVPMVQLDKHKVLQILVNVIQNAKNACDEAKGSDKRVTVRICTEHDSLMISVTDTGVGIAAENLARIFNHGFTTRSRGHGFGLHSSALAAKELGGSLRAESPGLGQGATFTLTLPVTLTGVS